MKGSYDHQRIEKKWRARHRREKLYQIDLSTAENNYYALDMFPYPSGHGLHVGHWRGYVLSDYYARYQMLHGKTVLHPMGLDSFGLPAENAAIKHKSYPKKFTDEAITNIRRQLEQIGAAFDWSKYLSTCEPNYYHWTQWLFLQFFIHGLAEKRSSLVNWCPNDQTVLANEQVINGHCERCNALVTKKELPQWFLKTTEYAQELLDGLEEVNWPERVKRLQRDWIGRSDGVLVVFDSPAGPIEVFTTRVDTIFGVSAIVIAPEHPLAEKLIQESERAKVETYFQQLQSKTDVDRQQAEAKAGVATGSVAKHPLTGQELEVWLADYVLLNYGTGAVMSVPAHDERDHQFAKQHQLPILQVIEAPDPSKLPYTGNGTLVNSAEFTSLSVNEAQEKIIAKLQQLGHGQKKSIYRLRDWLVSRQRYWGAPIPIVYDPEGNPHPVKEEHLPLLLPTDVDFLPGGESPIKRSRDYQELAEKLYGKGWQFETDTLDTFVDSSWYFFRYLSPTDKKRAFDPALIKKWLPVDLYVGGIEHATLHLLYARFVTKFLAAYGYIDQKISEPFAQLYSIGSINLHGSRMSKSKGNIIEPDPLIEHYGTDALRGYELFIGPLDVEAEWNPRGINGIHRFLIKLNNYYQTVQVSDENSEIESEFNQYLTTIQPMIDDFRLNTVISEAMKLLNGMPKTAPKTVLEGFLITLAPIFPYLTEELWERLGHEKSIFKATYPVLKAVAGSKSIQVMVNQKFIATLDKAMDEHAAVAEALKLPAVQIKLGGKKVTKTIFKAGQLLNLIVRD